MRIPVLMLMSLLVTASPALAADARVHVRGHVMAMPLPNPILGAGFEVRDKRLRLSLAAEAAMLAMGPNKVWATWLNWTPSGSGDQGFSVLAGYNQSYRLFPGPPAMPPSPGSPDPGWELPGMLIGLAYEWSGPNWWLRVSPHLGVGYDQYWQWTPTFRSLFAGPPLAEVGWQPVEHLEVGLRLSLTPLRLGYRF